MTIKQSMMLSAILNKIDLTINAEMTQSQVGADIIAQLAKNAYKAETEIIDFVANLLKINKQEAEEQDISVIVEAIKADKSFATFFSQAGR